MRFVQRKSWSAASFLSDRINTLSDQIDDTPESKTLCMLPFSLHNLQTCRAAGRQTG